MTGKTYIDYMAIFHVKTQLSTETEDHLVKVARVSIKVSNSWKSSRLASYVPFLPELCFSC